jgi:hypothetical protein
MPTDPRRAPAISPAPPGGAAGGHFHAAYADDGDVLIWHCTVKHREKKTGRSILACKIAQEGGEAAWKFVAWRRGLDERRQFDGSDVDAKVFIFSCKSWRCAGNCRDYVFRRDMRRIIDALKKRPRWLVAVLTLSPKRWKSGRDSAYRNLWRRWQQLRARLARWLDRKVEYIATIEQHTERIAGWPHVNLALYWRGMEDVRNFEGYGRGIRRWLKDQAPECGFGFSVECSPMRDAVNWGGYMAGASVGKRGTGPYKDKALAQVAGEILKKDRQAPVSAPANFRRIRASRNLLPPLKKSDGEWALAIAVKKHPEALRGRRRWCSGGR